MKNIITKNVHESLLKGVNKLANAVESTLGPEGRNVMIDQISGVPHITKDGVTVAKAIHVKDRVENMGIQLIKQAAEQTAREAGDGTTTSTVLARAIVSRSVELIREKKINPMIFRQGMYKAVDEFTEFLQSISSPITPEQYFDIAMIASNGDKNISQAVAKAKQEVGQYGQVLYTPSHNNGISVEVTEGMQIKSGMITKQLSGNNNVVTLKNAYVIVMGFEVLFNKDVSKLLGELANNPKYRGSDLLIVCDGMEGEALSTVVQNVTGGVFNVAVVRTPFANDREGVLMDICTYTGATLIAEGSGLRPKDVDFRHAGISETIEIHANQTVLMGGRGNQIKIKDRIKYLEKSIQNTPPSLPSHNELKMRLASFAGKVAIINIGSQNTAHLKEMQDVVDDTICAVNSAAEEGFVPGGGNTFNKAKLTLLGLERGLGGDYNLGYMTAISILDAPIKAILNNAGLNQTKIEGSKFYYFVNGRLVVFSEPKNTIIDPAKVLRVAFKNAVTAAATIITTSCILELDADFVKEVNEYSFKNR